MEDKGEVKCIKFSLGIKILAVQRTSKSVVRKLTSPSFFINYSSRFDGSYKNKPDDAFLQDFINFIPDYPHIEFTQECKVGRRARPLPLFFSRFGCSGESFKV